MLSFSQKYLLALSLLANPLSTASADSVHSCRQTAGQQRAQLYVRQCLQVSPATHPPCNPTNSCGLLIEEIQRGCRMLTTDIPGFCKSYVRGP
jgi:hypothetical protein